jgi:sugar phosphate isomerase/epimerase
VLAIENHIDLLADELVDLIETVDSKWIGVCLDTANNLRMLEDLRELSRSSPLRKSDAYQGCDGEGRRSEGFRFLAKRPLGKGLIDIPRVFEVLRAQNYDGLLALEIDYLHPAYSDDQRAIAESVAYMRGLL